jgi:NAD(P)H-quinone oxidoreductase subunit 5
MTVPTLETASFATSVLETAFLIPLYPLVGAFFSLLWVPGLISRTGPRPSGYINLFFNLIAFLHSLGAWIAFSGTPLTRSWPWLDTAGLSISFDATINQPVLIAMTMICGIHVLAQVYAIGYLEMDWGWPRFFGCLSVFEAGLCALVLTDSLFFAYVVLELLTLGTYLVVGTWFNQSLVVKGARDAFLTKRVGDLVLLAGLVALLPVAGTWNINELNAWAQQATTSPALTLILLALIAGPMGKCAQIPLHLWLDEAMEGPFPSTVLRNSVVVVGGAWVLLRLQPLLAVSPTVQAVLVIVGGTTALVGALIALAQIDIKRAISFLVSSWLGLLFLAVGAGAGETAWRMMLIYPLPMALVLLALGTVVSSNVSQDLTQLGGLWSRRPLMGIAFLVGAAGLVGLPPLAGFGALRAMAASLAGSQAPVLLTAVVLITNGLISAALVRIFGLIWGGKPSVFTKRSAEVLWLMVLPTMVATGLVLHLPILINRAGYGEAWGPMALPLLASTLIGISSGAVLYLFSTEHLPKLPGPLAGLQHWLAADLHTEGLYRRTVVGLVVVLAASSSWLDRALVDGFSNRSGDLALEGARRLSFSTTGRVQAYAFTVLIGVVLMGIWILTRHTPTALTF